MAQVKDIDIDGKVFFIHRLNAWKQITFAADLQKELIKPIFGGGAIDGSEIQGDIIGGISSVLSSERLEYWVKKLLDEGLVAAESEDGTAKRMTFAQLDTMFDDPMSIIQLIREVFEYNFLDFFKRLFASTGLDISALPKSL